MGKGLRAGTVIALLLLLPIAMLSAEKQRKSSWEMGFGFPFSIPMEKSIEQQAVDKSNYGEAFYFGVRSQKLLPWSENWSIGFSFTAMQTPLSRYNMTEIVDDSSYLRFIISGAAVSWYTETLNKGFFLSVSGGPAIIDVGKGSSYKEEMATKFLGGGIEGSLGYSLQTRYNFSVIFAAKGTYCGAYIEDLASYWDFYNISFYLGFAF